MNPQRIVRGPDGVVHRFPSDASDTEIASALEQSGVGGGAGATRSMPARLATPAAGGLPGWVAPAVGAIPAVTSGVAGLLGGEAGPLSYGLAAAGGGVGELGRQLLAQQLGLSPPSGINWGSVGTQAGVGASSQLAGGLIGKGLARGGEALMGSALGTKYLARYPSMAREALAGGVLPVKNALRSVATKIGISSARLNALLTRAGEQGHRFDLGEITAPVEREIARLGKSRVPAAADKAHELQDLLGRFVKRNAQPYKLEPLDVNEIKTTSQAFADPQLARQAAGTVKPISPTEQHFHQLIAQGSQKALEGLDQVPGLVPKGELGVAARNLKTQGLMGVQRAIRAARPSGIGGFAARHVLFPVASAGAAAMLPGNRLAHAGEAAAAAEALSTPAIAGRLAHGLNNPLLQMLQAQAPRAASAALVPQP